MFPSLPRLLETASMPFKRSQYGLFHGKTKQFGNNVPFSKNKTRRSWLPNIQDKRVFSNTLQRVVKVRLTTKALKTIRKYGGLDEYLLKTKYDLLGLEGMRLRLLVKEKLEDNAAKGIQTSDSAMLKLPRAITQSVRKSTLVSKSRPEEN